MSDMVLWRSQAPSLPRLRLRMTDAVPQTIRINWGVCTFQACGFDLIFESVEEGQPEEGFAVLVDDATLEAVRAALYLISPDEPRAAPPRVPAQSPAQQVSQSQPVSLLSQSANASDAASSSSAAAPPDPPLAAAAASSAPAAAHANAQPIRASMQQQHPRPRNTQVCIPLLKI